MSHELMRARVTRLLFTLAAGHATGCTNDVVWRGSSRRPSALEVEHALYRCRVVLGVWIQLHVKHFLFLFKRGASIKLVRHTSINDPIQVERSASEARLEADDTEKGNDGGQNPNLAAGIAATLRRNATETETAEPGADRHTLTSKSNLIPLVFLLSMHSVTSMRKRLGPFCKKSVHALVSLDPRRSFSLCMA